MGRSPQALSRSVFILLPLKDAFMSSVPLPAAANQDLDSTLREFRVFPRRRSSAPGPTSRALKSTRPSTSSPSLTLKPSGRRRQRPPLVQALDKVLDGICPRQVVCRRQAQPLLQLRRPPCARPSRRQDRAHLGRRAGRDSPPHLRELHVEVQRFANALKSLGIKKGDRVPFIWA